ncbi:MAG: hypothetical protein K1000chlam3_01098 [Chlamydiae bacterium]|nr:hypothetical protein [Chlamydiota bacterium]
MAKKTLGVNPWTHIWIKPRETLKKVVRFNPKYRFVILSFIYGLPMLLHMAQNLSVGEQFNIVGIVIVALVLATFVGMLGLTIASALVYWTGKWIGGKANYFPVRAAVSWSNVPNIIAIIVWAILIYNFRDHIFLSEFDEMNFVGGQMTLITGALVVQAAIAIWSFIILVKGLGEVQGFSAWKGVLNVLIPFFMIGILIWVITWLFWACNGMPGA